MYVALVSLNDSQIAQSIPRCVSQTPLNTQALCSEHHWISLNIIRLQGSLDNHEAHFTPPTSSLIGLTCTDWRRTRPCLMLSGTNLLMRRCLCRVLTDASRAEFTALERLMEILLRRTERRRSCCAATSRRTGRRGGAEADCRSL